jgi:hypothetical protein
MSERLLVADDVEILREYRPSEPSLVRDHLEVATTAGNRKTRR